MTSIFKENEQEIEWAMEKYSFGFNVGSRKKKGEKEPILCKLKKVGSCLGTFTLKAHGRA